MPDELQVLIFDIKGNVEVTSEAEQASTTDQQPSDSKGQASAPAKENPAGSEKIAADLNRKSISQDIERELRRILPPTITVQASVRFEAGSLIVSGMVALLSWAGPITLDAAKEELGKLVKLCVQRAISRHLPSIVGAIEMSVTPQAVTPGRRSARSFAPDKPGAITALFVITGIILVLQLMLLFDRFFLIHLRP
jgi:hypothetical protein